MKFENYLTKQLRADESVVALIRTSWVHYMWPLVGWLLLLVADVFFLYPLQSLGRWGALVFLVVLIIVAFGLARIAFVRSRNVFVLTTERLIDIDQRGFFERFVAECPLEQIQDIRYTTSGLPATLFRIGRVIVDTGSAAGHIELVDVQGPAEVKELITNEQHNHSRKSHGEQEI